MKFKVAARPGDPKLMTGAIKSYVEVEDMNTRDCALEGFELFGCMKQKLDLPPNSICDSCRLDKVDYSIPHLLPKQFDNE